MTTNQTNLEENRERGEREELLCFTVGGKRFALSADEVERVAALPCTAISPLAVPHECLLGFLNQRGRAVSVVLFPGMNFDPVFPGERPCIIVRTDAVQYAFFVDCIDGMRTGFPIPGEASEPFAVLSGRMLFDAICEGDDL